MLHILLNHLIQILFLVLPEYVQESLLNFIIANEKDAATHNNPDTAIYGLLVCANR